MDDMINNMMKDKMILYMSVCYILEPNKSENAKNKLSAYAIIKFESKTSFRIPLQKNIIFSKIKNHILSKIKNHIILHHKMVYAYI